jgi:hypothetical protein
VFPVLVVCLAATPVSEDPESSELVAAVRSVAASLNAVVTASIVELNVGETVLDWRSGAIEENKSSKSLNTEKSANYCTNSKASNVQCLLKYIHEE